MRQTCTTALLFDPAIGVQKCRGRFLDIEAGRHVERIPDGDRVPRSAREFLWVGRDGLLDVDQALTFQDQGKRTDTCLRGRRPDMIVSRVHPGIGLVDDLPLIGHHHGLYPVISVDMVIEAARSPHPSRPHPDDER